LRLRLITLGLFEVSGLPKNSISHVPYGFGLQARFKNVWQMADVSLTGSQVQ
jgi:hypothetical protein